MVKKKNHRFVLTLPETPVQCDIYYQMKLSVFRVYLNEQNQGKPEIPEATLAVYLGTAGFSEYRPAYITRNTIYTYRHNRVVY